jgi:hypothetical protein
MNQEYSASLNKLFEVLVNYFMGGTDNDDQQLEKNESFNFYICSILSRHICSSGFKTSPINNTKTLDFFRLLLDECSRRDRKYSRRIQKGLLKRIHVSTFYVEFLKSSINHAKRLNSALGVDIDPTETFKSMFALFINCDNSSLEFELSSDYLLLATTDQHQASSNKSGAVHDFLIKSLAFSVNSFTGEQFKSILDYFNAEIKEKLNSSDADSSQLVYKLAKFFRYLCCEIEIEHELKEEYLIFIQKVCSLVYFWAYLPLEY